MILVNNKMKAGKCTYTIKKNTRSVANIEYGVLHSMDILFLHTTLTLFNQESSVPYLVSLLK